MCFACTLYSLILNFGIPMYLGIKGDRFFSDLRIFWGRLLYKQIGVGTFKDGCIHRVPLPRVPRVQSTSPVACSTTHMNPIHTGYSPVKRILKWSDMLGPLSGLGRCIERYIPPFSPVRLM
jgi:hypothetical protein